MADEGASPRELVLEACRRNNTDLLQDVIDSFHKKSPKTADAEVADLLNNARDGIGQGVLHIAAANGHYEILDALLDLPNVHIDTTSRLEADTPLHKAVRYVNSLQQADWQHGYQIVDILLDAGCDPRIKNGAKLKPIELADPRNDGLRNMLRRAEYSMMAGGDVVEEDEDDGGPASDSD